MIIDLRTILEDSRHFEFSLEQDWLQSDENIDPGFKIDRPFAVQADIYKAGDKFILEGRFEGGTQLRCDRCLEPFHHESKVRFRSVLAAISPDDSEGDRELIEKDLDLDIMKADVIDLADLVQEQIYLDLPLKKICRPDCRGLCPSCGTNMNLKKCSCQQDHGHPVFQKLKTLKIK